MPKPLLLLSCMLTFFFLTTGRAKSQDTLRLKNKNTIACKVYKIGDTEIEYRKWDNQEGPLYTIDKNKVTEIRFANGSIEKFEMDEMDVAQEQAILDKRNSIKLDLFSPVFDKITLGFEHCIKVGWNAEAYMSFISTKILPNGVGQLFMGDSKVQGVALRIGNKFFLGSDYYVKGTRYAHPLKGRFIRVDLSYSQFAILNVYQHVSGFYNGNYYVPTSYNKGSLNVSQFGLGVSYGRQFILGNIFTLQYNVGVNYAGEGSKYEVSETNAKIPNNSNYYRYYNSEYSENYYLTIPNILRLGRIPVGFSGNLTFGYIIGGNKKEKLPVTTGLK